MLSECRHDGLGVHNCFMRSEVAGVNCSGKFVPYLSEEDYIKPLQIQSVMRLISDWLMVQQLTLEEWRYVSMESGAQYVMTTGMLEVHRWCVDN